MQFTSSIHAVSKSVNLFGMTKVEQFILYFATCFMIFDAWKWLRYIKILCVYCFESLCRECSTQQNIYIRSSLPIYSVWKLLYENWFLSLVSNRHGNYYQYWVEYPILYREDPTKLHLYMRKRITMYLVWKLLYYEESSWVQISIDTKTAM